MASADGIFCGVCETQHVARDATFWCLECVEGLCSSCENLHRASKASKNHEVTSVNNYQQIQHTIASINQYCPGHEKKYEHYCSQHKTLCCPLCITTNHNKCDLLAIDEIVNMPMIFAFFDIMEQSLEEMKVDIEGIVEDRRQNLRKIQQQRQRFQTDIKEIREKINKHLDKLENEIQQDIQAAEQKVQSQIERLLSKVSDHGKSLDELKKNIFATKSFATDLQIFFGGKMFEAEIQKEEKFMQSLIEDGSLQQINLECKIADKVSDILSMTEIGEISAITNLPTITLTIDREQAQQMIPKISKKINVINLTLLKRFRISKGEKVFDITGCTFMPSRNMVFVDHQNDRLVIHNANGLFDCEIPVPHSPIDVTCIEENTVAVTHNIEPYHIEIINIANRKIVKRIKTSNVSYGITNKGGRLLYYELGRGIQTADVTNESTVTTVVKVDGEHHWDYVTTLKDKIYRTSYNSNTVTCYEVTGQTVWEYQDKLILKGIRGVAVDNNYNVYVVSHGNDSVVVVSPDGQHARRLLGEENGIKYPYGIHFDQGRNILLVSNLYGKAFLYNIK